MGDCDSVLRILGYEQDKLGFAVSPMTKALAPEAQANIITDHGAVRTKTQNMITETSTLVRCAPRW